MVSVVIFPLFRELVETPCLPLVDYLYIFCTICAISFHGQILLCTIRTTKQRFFHYIMMNDIIPSFVTVTPFGPYCNLCDVPLSVQKGIFNHGKESHPDFSFKNASVVREVQNKITTLRATPREVVQNWKLEL